MPKVLVIEDEPSIVMILREFLTDQGYEVCAEYNGKAGLKRLNELPLPDAVIIDLNMPGIGGKEVIKHMRSCEELKNIPVIITTGNAYSPGDFPSKGSYQAVVEKPFELFDMLNVIKRITLT
ncbi:MAG TPA: hypothetical protein DD426_00810 [Clostridiaceae bacterium]|nr:hypothetical protein [Clostridiaceae bacterium]